MAPLRFSLAELLICVSKRVSTQMYYLSVSPEKHNSRNDWVIFPAFYLFLHLLL